MPVAVILPKFTDTQDDDSVIAAWLVSHSLWYRQARMHELDRVRIGMTLPEVEALLGAPSFERPDCRLEGWNGGYRVTLERGDRLRVHRLLVWEHLLELNQARAVGFDEEGRVVLLAVLRT